MTKVQYLLTCIAEECAEVAQRASKAARFGLYESQDQSGDLSGGVAGKRSNYCRLLEEYSDIKALVSMLEQEVPYVQRTSTDFSREQLGELIEKKKQRVRKYMNYSRDVGQVSYEAEY